MKPRSPTDLEAAPRTFAMKTMRCSIFRTATLACAVAASFGNSLTAPAADGFADLDLLDFLRKIEEVHWMIASITCHPYPGTGPTN